MTGMAILSSIGLVAAIGIGIVTAVVTCRAMRPVAGKHSPAIGIFVGALTAVGLSNHGGNMSALLIPYEALGIAIVIMLLLRPFLGGVKGKHIKSHLPIFSDRSDDGPDDPWAKEIREGGKKAHQFKSRKRT